MVAERTQRAIEKAVERGTLGKIDRSKQYEDAEERSSAALLRSQNHLWARMRTLELYLRILTAAVTLAGLVLAIVKAIR